MNDDKYFIILLLFCFFIFLNSVSAISNETNNDIINPNDTLELSNNTVEIESDELKIPTTTITNDTQDNILDSNKKTPVKTKIDAKDVTKYYGEKITIKATLKNSKNKGISKKKITITCDGKTFKEKTNSKGKIKFTLNKKHGTYTIKFAFKHSGFKSSSKKITLQVKKMPTKFNLQNNVFEYSETNRLKINLKDKNNKNVANKKIIIKFMNNTYEKTTDSKGIVILDFKAKPNDYALFLSFDDKNNNYESSKLNEKITVKPIPTNMEVNDLNYNYDNGTNNYLYATLKDIKNNKLLEKKIINFKINNKTISVKTDENGQARLQINEKPGIYTAEVSFSSSEYLNIIKNVKINVTSYYPSVNYDGGFYKTSNLNLTLNVNNANLIKYKLNNETWNYATKSVTYKLNNGIYDLYYEKDNQTICHEHYVIDNKAPLAWCNYYSDLYSNPILVNLSCWDNLDNNSKIYYTLDGSNPMDKGVLYTAPINIRSTTCLKFYSQDFVGLKSDVVTSNYIFDNVANINSGKGFTTIQSAIDDADTREGDTIKVNPGFYNEQITVNKSLNLISYNATLQGSVSTRPVIGINSNGKNSIISGFNIVDSSYGIVILDAVNVSLISNTFINVLDAIETDRDTNSFIAYNTIKSTQYLSSMSGIVIGKSDNLTVLKNNIQLNSDQNSVGIIVTNATSDNISIIDNNISNSNQFNGIGLYIVCSNIQVISNNVSNFHIGLYVLSSNSLFIANQFFNNDYGVYLTISGNNIYKSNNIFDNDKFGVFLDSNLVSENDSFYLNRLCDNGYYDFLFRGRMYLCNQR